ncbi:hypothetical protein [Vulgatibacter sp.]|uniref:hypothetical protein n=1 Tax=Vulgatibacter sp. TaxID=1971226 RepID=UPI003563E405
MNRMHQRYPDVARLDAPTVLFSQWTVGTAARQRAAADAAHEAWSRTGWPAGLAAHASFASADGATLLHHSQWKDPAAVAGFRDGDRRNWMAAVDAAVPGIERDWAFETRLYRSMRPGDPARTGCLVLVSFETDGPHAQHAFVDALFERVETAPASHHPGAISSHFHLSTDGSRIFNYSEWTSAKAHEEMLATQLRPDGALVRFIERFAGLRPLGFRRYELLRSRAGS